MANRSLSARRYFGAFILIVAVLYGLVFRRLRPDAAARAGPARRHDRHAHRPHARRPGARPRGPRARPSDHRAAGQRPRRRRGRGRHRGRLEHRHLRPRGRRRPGPRAGADRPAALPPRAGRRRTRPTPAGRGRRADRRRGAHRPGGAERPDRTDRRRARPTRRRPDRRRRADRGTPRRRPTARPTRPRPAIPTPRRSPRRRRRSPSTRSPAATRRPATSPCPRTTSRPAARTARSSTSSGPAVVEGTAVSDASAGTRAGTGEWVVNLDFDNEGGAAWGEFTAANVGNAVAHHPGRPGHLRADRQGAILGGATEITGDFDQETATELANQLKYGALPLSFTQATAQSISTELGEEQLQAGLLAGAIGIALVFLYSLLYYRALGLVMIASLVLSGVVVYGVLVVLGREIGFTLSLAGIAGFIVSLGITADSFVVYFERLKDEIREGRSLRSAVPAGLGPRPADDPLRRRGQLPGRGDPLRARHRRREGLRVHPRHVHGPRPGRRLPLHPPADGGALPLQVVRQRPDLRARAGRQVRLDVDVAHGPRPRPGRRPRPAPRRRTGALHDPRRAGRRSAAGGRAGPAWAPRPTRRATPRTPAPRPPRRWGTTTSPRPVCRARAPAT